MLIIMEHYNKNGLKMTVLNNLCMISHLMNHFTSENDTHKGVNES